MLAAATGESVTLSMVVSGAFKLELFELERLLRVNARSCFSSAATAAIRLAVTSSRCCCCKCINETNDCYYWLPRNGHACIHASSAQKVSVKVLGLNIYL